MLEKLQHQPVAAHLKAEGDQRKEDKEASEFWLEILTYKEKKPVEG